MYVDISHLPNDYTAKSITDLHSMGIVVHDPTKVITTTTSKPVYGPPQPSLIDILSEQLNDLSKELNKLRQEGQALKIRLLVSEGKISSEEGENIKKMLLSEDIGNYEFAIALLENI
jgi:hypothetical protein